MINEICIKLIVNYNESLIIIHLKTIFKHIVLWINYITLIIKELKLLYVLKQKKDTGVPHCELHK